MPPVIVFPKHPHLFFDITAAGFAVHASPFNCLATHLFPPGETLGRYFLVENIRAERSWAFIYDEANFDNELLVAALDFELRVAFVALQTHA